MNEIYTSYIFFKKKKSQINFVSEKILEKQSTG